jgi:predicted GIY-YIG superfamily endonuclease
MRAEFSFPDACGSGFAGLAVRVAGQPPTAYAYACVADVVRAIMPDTAEPRAVARALYDAHPDVLQWMSPDGEGEFWAGVDGVAQVASLLPGARAAEFRGAPLQALARFMSPSSPEPQDAHVVEADVRSHPLPPRAAEYPNPKYRRFVLKRTGESLAPYYGKYLVYLIEFEFHGTVYVKVGYTTDMRERMATHASELPGCQVYNVYTSEVAHALEAAFKDMYAQFNTPLNVNGKLKTELFAGITLEEADAGLALLHAEQSLKTEDARRLEELRAERQMELRRMEHEREMRAMEREMKRMETQVRLKLVELELARLYRYKAESTPTS